MAKRGERKERTWDPMRDHFDRENVKRIFVSLYVSNIPDKLDQNGLRNLFLKYGNVRGVRILPKNYNTQKSAGFVNYETKEEAQRAIQELDRRDPFQLNVRMKRTEKPSDFAKQFPGFGISDDLLPRLDDSDADDNDSEDESSRIRNSLNLRANLNKERRDDIANSSSEKSELPGNKEKQSAFRQMNELMRGLAEKKDQNERTLSGMGRGIKNISKMEESPQTRVPVVRFFGSIGRGISKKLIIDEPDEEQNKNRPSLQERQSDDSSCDVLPGAKLALNHQKDNATNEVCENEKPTILPKSDYIAEGEVTRDATRFSTATFNIKKQDYEDSAMNTKDEMDTIPSVDSLKLELDQQVNVIVSQIDSLNFIWVQLYDNVMGEFKCLEDSLKIESSKYVSMDHYPKIGGVYLVHFPGNKWHRGKITDINIDKSYNVLYIDYGNVQTNIKKREVKLLSQSSLKYPAQAIRCKVCPTAKKRYATTTEFANAILGNAVRIIVQKFEDNIPIIDFIENLVPDNPVTTITVKPDETSPEQMLENNVCDSADEKNERASSPTKATEPGLVDDNHLELPVIAENKTSNTDDDWNTSSLNCLEMGDELNLKWINSTFRLHFWAQAIPRKIDSLCKDVLDLRTLTVEKWMTHLDVSSVSKGDIVAAKSMDGSYYRAVVLGNEGATFRVFFVDYGKEEEVIDLKKIRDEYKTKPSLAVICAVSEEAATSNFQKYLEENRLRVTEKKVDCVKAMLNCNTQSVSITIEPWFTKFNVQDDKIISKTNIATTDNENAPSQLASQISSPKITVDALPKAKVPEENYLSVLIVNVNSATDISVHSEKIFQVDSTLSKLLNSGLMTSDSASYTAVVGELVCAKSQLDTYWYRAEILNIKKTQATVLFIDFGNQESVPLIDVKPIPDEALKFEKLSLIVALENSPDSLQPLEQVINKKLITMKIINRNEHPIRVEFFKDDEPIFPSSSTARTEQCSVKTEEKPAKPNLTVARNEVTKMKTLNDMKCSTLPLGRVDVAITFVQSPEMIFCIRTCDDQISSWTTLSEAVNEYGRTVPQKSHVPLLGEVCVVFYKDDGAWYRAVCLDIQQKYLMFFLDFGITDEVLPKNIRPITDELFQYPIMVAHCKLIDYKNKEWGAEDLECVKAVIPAGSAMTIEVVSYDIAECVDYVYWIKLV